MPAIVRRCSATVNELQQQKQKSETGIEQYSIIEVFIRCVYKTINNKLATAFNIITISLLRLFQFHHFFLSVFCVHIFQTRTKNNAQISMKCCSWVWARCCCLFRFTFQRFCERKANSNRTFPTSVRLKIQMRIFGLFFSLRQDLQPTTNGSD